ncbi:hypothetical protein [Aporhodopirellula aestuarii]|uniref:Secreted protein n=1 Tax=Aporhodopirellula aestuarii TaxID=2950107 RepID=A0ABT0TYJ2_9BACT|nr:hypothetical protein [Aporhodopirellula aestuarii]MCM2369551.1 hypothetical protein [Aporhodopirellula aestuarii]
MNRHPIITAITFGFLCTTAISVSHLRADDGLFDRGVSTETGDVLEGQADLATGLGRGALLRSLSAVQLQRALQLRLENREESLEQYYDLRSRRGDNIEQDAKANVETYKRVMERSRHDRLTQSQINHQTGELYWPRPLDHEALKPFRKPIEESLAKRSSPGETYDRFDYLKVAKMLGLITEAVESIESELEPREVVALKQYLEQIDYDARFDANDERVDF